MNKNIKKLVMIFMTGLMSFMSSNAATRPVTLKTSVQRLTEQHASLDMNDQNFTAMFKVLLIELLREEFVFQNRNGTWEFDQAKFQQLCTLPAQKIVDSFATWAGSGTSKSQRVEKLAKEGLCPVIHGVVEGWKDKFTDVESFRKSVHAFVTQLETDCQITNCFVNFNQWLQAVVAGSHNAECRATIIKMLDAKPLSGTEQKGKFDGLMLVRNPGKGFGYTATAALAALLTAGNKELGCPCGLYDAVVAVEVFAALVVFTWFVKTVFLKPLGR